MVGRGRGGGSAHSLKWTQPLCNFCTVLCSAYNGQISDNQAALIISLNKFFDNFLDETTPTGEILFWTQVDGLKPMIDTQNRTKVITTFESFSSKNIYI